jgi:hypothetical protein
MPAGHNPSSCHIMLPTLLRVAAGGTTTRGPVLIAICPGNNPPVQQRHGIC